MQWKIEEEAWVGQAKAFSKKQKQVKLPCTYIFMILLTKVHTVELFGQ